MHEIWTLSGLFRYGKIHVRRGPELSKISFPFFRKASSKEEFCSLEMSVGDSAGYNNGYGKVSDAFHKEWKDACMKSDHPNTLVCPDKGVLKIEDEEYKDVAKDVKDLAKAAKYEINWTTHNCASFYFRMKGRKKKKPRSKKGVQSGNQAGNNAGQTRPRFVRKRKKCKRNKNCKKKNRKGTWKKKRRKGNMMALAKAISAKNRKKYKWIKINKMAKGTTGSIKRTKG